jgi:HSP20 family molecular chaperone IbpA
MWAEACEMLARAEQLHRSVFQPRHAGSIAAWEPPADVLETAREVLVLVALPGVDPDTVQALIQDGELVVVGNRILPSELRTAVIHRLELPHGRFERRLPLPAGRYGAIRRTAAFGCLAISLEKMEGLRG